MRQRISVSRFLCMLLLGCLVSRAEAQGVADLVGNLSSEDEKTRWQAARDLGAMGPAAANAVGALGRALEDRSPLVRAHAAHALGLIGPRAKSAADALARRIADEDANVRREAVAAIHKIDPGPDVVIPLVVKVLEDADEEVRIEALHTLAERGAQAVPNLIKALGRDESRYWACLVLAEIGPEAKAATPALVEILKSEKAEVRLEALMALGAILPKDETAITAIAAALQDEEHSVRYAATFALGNIGPDAKAARRALIPNARSDDAFLSTISIWALSKLDPHNQQLTQRAVPRLVAALKHDDKRVRVAAARALVNLDADPEIVAPAMIKMLEQGDAQTLAMCVEACAEVGEAMVPRAIDGLKNEKLQLHSVLILARLGEKAQAAVPALIDELRNEPDEDYRREVFLALAAIGPGSKAAIPHLIEELDDDDVKVRNGASFALGQIGPAAKDALPKLKQNFQRKDDQLHYLVTAWAMARIAPDDEEVAKVTVPVLITGLEHEEPMVRRKVAATLGMLGPRARAATAALQALEDDPEEAVRADAAAALKKIGGS